LTWLSAQDTEIMQLEDETNNLYQKSWQEIYELLKKELRK